MFEHSNHRNDNGFERQVFRAAQKLCFGVRVKNPWLVACAEIITTEFDPKKQIPNCSNGKLHFSMYVPAKKRP